MTSHRGFPTHCSHGFKKDLARGTSSGALEPVLGRVSTLCRWFICIFSDPFRHNIRNLGSSGANSTLNLRLAWPSTGTFTTAHPDRVST